MTDNAEWPDHDSTRWGVRWVDAERRQSVRRVADVIRCRIQNDTPLSETAAGVIDELARLLPEVSAWSILDPKGRPAPLSAEDEWEPSSPHFHGREHDSYPEWKRTAAGSDWAGFAAAHAAVGLPGALLCLRSTFAHAACAADLDNGIAARIAVPEAVALHVAGLSPAATAVALVCNGSDAASGTRLSLVPVVAELQARNSAARAEREQQALANFTRAKDPDDKWKPAHQAELLRQFGILTGKGPGRLNADVAHAVLGGIWGIAPTSVKTYLTKARGAKPSAAAQA